MQFYFKLHPFFNKSLQSGNAAEVKVLTDIYIYKFSLLAIIDIVNTYYIYRIIERK